MTFHWTISTTIPVTAIALLAFPFLDAFRRRHGGLALELACVGVPFAAVLYAQETIPLLVLATTFITGSMLASDHFSFVDRLLLACAFGVTFGLLGRLVVGPDWMVLSRGEWECVACLLPLAAGITWLASRWR